jgi:molybdate/tungstate transport system substrate-binding protein
MHDSRLILQNFRRLWITFLIPFLLVALGCNQNNPQNNKDMASQELIIFHAGSLSVPFKEAADSFRKQHPEVDIKLEAAGSVDCARKITELNRECDIMASADYRVIDKLLIPGHTEWLIRFAANEMVLVYYEGSRFSDEINQENWTSYLMRDRVYYGRSNPDSDPCGYRTVLTLRLAEDYYKHRGLAAQLLAKDQRFIRPKETDLLALLESGALDYAFLYRSVAEQHGLPYITLPDSVNLGNPDLKDHYAQATVDIAGKKPGEPMTMKGEPMIYGITRLKDAPNPEVAKAFLHFLLNPDQGMEIMEKNGQPSLVPAPTEHYQNIPSEFQEYARPL